MYNFPPMQPREPGSGDFFFPQPREGSGSYFVVGTREGGSGEGEVPYDVYTQSVTTTTTTIPSFLGNLAVRRPVYGEDWIY